MSNPWIRLYRASLHSPKIVTLSDRQFRAWHNCLLIADDAGVLPSLRDIAVHMRTTVTEAEQLVCELVEAQLIDPSVMADGKRTYTMHDWSQHQHKSDDVAERMRRHREKKRNGDVTVTSPNVTCSVPESESYSDTDTDTDLVSSQPVAARTRPEETKLRFDIGSAKTKTTKKGKGDYIRERAEGLGLPVDELWAKSASKKKPAAYFTTLCVDKLRSLHPIIDEKLIRDALWEVETTRYGHLMRMIVGEVAS